MEITEVPITEIIPYEKNPRKNDRAIEVVAKSIKEFGFKVPIILDKNNVIIAGHTRLKAAIKLGLETVPIIWADDLTEEQTRAFRIMDNKSGEYSYWDEEKLIEEIKNLPEEQVLDTGFSKEEIEYLLDKFDLEQEKISSKEIEDTDFNQNKYNIQKGEIIIFDNKHRVICEDSKNEQAFIKLMNNQKIDLVVTSPPYNLDIKYGEYKDNKEIHEYLQEMTKIFSNIKDHMNYGRFLCINIGREWGPINLPAKYDIIMEKTGFTFFRNIYWKKPLGSARATITSRNPFPRYYVPKVQTEVIEIYSYDFDNPEFMNSMVTYKFSEAVKDKKEKIPQMLLNKYAGNVWTIMTETHQSEHSAPYPVQLPYNCIQFFSKKEENILDPFIGIGTTLIAADQLNRKCFGIELDPNYCSLIIERYKEYKEGAKIEVIGDGKRRDI